MPASFASATPIEALTSARSSPIAFDLRRGGGGLSALGLGVMPLGLAFEARVLDRRVAEYQDRLGHGADFVASVLGRNRDLGVAFGEPAHDLGHARERPGDDAAEQAPDPGDDQQADDQSGCRDAPQERVEGRVIGRGGQARREDGDRLAFVEAHGPGMAGHAGLLGPGERLGRARSAGCSGTCRRRSARRDVRRPSLRRRARRARFWAGDRASPAPRRRRPWDSRRSTTGRDSSCCGSRTSC